MPWMDCHLGYVVRSENVVIRLGILCVCLYCLLDKSAIQFRVLNRSRGPAVWVSSAEQAGRVLFLPKSLFFFNNSLLKIR